MFELAAIATLPLGITDFSGAKGFTLAILGNLFLIFLAARLVAHFGKGEWGTCLSYFFGGLLVGWFVWENDSAVATMKSLGGMVFGG